MRKKKQTNKQKKKQKQKLTENNQIAACTIVVSVKKHSATLALIITRNESPSYSICD